MTMDKHSFSQFDADLEAIARKVLTMGGLVEAQLQRAIGALTGFDAKAADAVMQDGA